MLWSKRFKISGIWILMVFEFSCKPSLKEDHSQSIATPATDHANSTNKGPISSSRITPLEGVWISTGSGACKLGLGVKEDIYTFQFLCVLPTGEVNSQIETGLILVDDFNFTLMSNKNSCESTSSASSRWKYTGIGNGSLTIGNSDGQELLTKVSTSDLPSTQSMVTYGCYDKSGTFVPSPWFKF